MDKHRRAEPLLEASGPHQQVRRFQEEGLSGLRFRVFLGERGTPRNKTSLSAGPEKTLPRSRGAAWSSGGTTSWEHRSRERARGIEPPVAAGRPPLPQMAPVIFTGGNHPKPGLLNGGAKWISQPSTVSHLFTCFNGRWCLGLLK